jgi:hypothetical protein
MGFLMVMNAPPILLSVCGVLAAEKRPSAASIRNRPDATIIGRCGGSVTRKASAKPGTFFPSAAATSRIAEKQEEVMSRIGSLFAALVFLTALPALAQPRGLVSQLQRGGFVIVLRHAHAPQARPSPRAAAPGNRDRERQLDAAGIRDARAMGAAFRRLRIPVGRVLSSPTYRARETARLAGWPVPTTFPELGDGGHSMRRLGPREGEWLRAQAGGRPMRGTNTVIVTQMPNIAAAFPRDATGLTDGEALLFRDARLVARVRIADWAGMR